MSPGIHQPINVSPSDESCVLLFSTFICVRGGGGECWKGNTKTFLEIYLQLCDICSVRFSRHLYQTYCFYIVGLDALSNLWYFDKNMIFSVTSVYVYILNHIQFTSIPLPKCTRLKITTFYHKHHHDLTCSSPYKRWYCTSRVSSKYVKISLKHDTSHNNEMKRCHTAALACTTLPLTTYILHEVWLWLRSKQWWSEELKTLKMESGCEILNE